MSNLEKKWIQKIPRTAKFLAVLRIFLIKLFPNWTACSSITYTKHHVKDSQQGKSSALRFGKDIFAIFGT